MSLSTPSFSRQEQPSNLETQTFDYNALDSETRIFLQERARDIKGRLRSNARNAWEIGHDLVEVRARLQYGHFVSWLRAEFEWSERTAYNYINVFESFGSFANFAKLETTAAPSALYLLAAPSTPFDARAEALELVNGGKSITYKEAKAIVTRHKELQRTQTNRDSPRQHRLCIQPTNNSNRAVPICQENLSEALKSKNALPVTASASAAFESVEPQKNQPNPESLDPSDRVAQDDGREWVRIHTDRPARIQWNDRIGVVVARPRGSVYVQIDSFTPSFLESEVELIDEQPLLNVKQQLVIAHSSSEEVLPGKELEPELEPSQKNDLEASSSTCSNSKDSLETEDESSGSSTPLDTSDSPNSTNEISVEQLNVGVALNPVKPGPLSHHSGADTHNRLSKEGPGFTRYFPTSSSTKEELHSTEADALSTTLNSWSELGLSAISKLVIKEVESDQSATEVESDRSPLAEAGASKTELSPRSLVPEPKSQDKQLLPDVERNGDTPKDWKPPMPAVVINRAAIAQGMPEVVVTELAIALKGLAPEQLARLLIFVSNGLGKSKINAVIEAWSCTELERISTELKHITLQVDRESSRRNCSCAEKLEQKVLAPEVEVQ
jgi:hypothetical protein